MPIPLVIAHRGDSSNALENSLEAVRLALSVPVDMIEIDIRRCRDNGLYIMHDRMTGRTAEKNVDIERASSGQLNGIKLKNGEPVPSLASVLDLVAGACALNLELKSAGAGLLTAQHIRASGYKGSVLLSSFKVDEVRAVRTVMPALPTSMIFDVFTLHHVKSYAARGYKVISLRKKTVNEKLIVACHEQGIKVYVWTVDEEDEIWKFISWGVDGLYSNKPDVLKKLLERSELGVRS
jgi:glycerophosphoryl diester phosphodiesterase